MSSYSVKMMTRRSVQCLPSLFTRELVGANPFRQLLDAAVGLEAGLVGEFRHFVEKLLFAVEEGAGGVIAGRSDGFRGGGLHLGVGFGGESFLGEGGALVVGAD